MTQPQNALQSDGSTPLALDADVVVMKFGGTSVGSPERIVAAADRVVERIEAGQNVVVVTSAMSGETNRLIELGKEVGDSSLEGREYDQLVTAGEHASIALLALAIRRRGLKAKSLLAHQFEMKTKNVLGQDLISSINAAKIRELLDQGTVPVIAGFQGVDDNGDFTTLGRGGSDTTAVAIAAALESPCEILTDVDGVYSALPSICKSAKKQEYLNYEEMLELASSGAKVLQARSVSLAHKFKVPLIVALSFEERKGTLISEGYEGMEDAVVSGITCRTDESKLTLRSLPDEPGVAAKVFRALGDAGVVVDMIVQSQGQSGKTAISFTVPQESGAKAHDALKALLSDGFEGSEIDLDEGIAKLSVVGEGMRTHSGVASRMFEVLGAEGINVQMITTSEIKISVAIEEKYSELAVRVLHDAFIGADGTL